jgi:ATP-dependent RNA helicase SUPV3L1/SUV3
MEMWERLNGLGKKCALRTGEVTSGPMDNVEAEYTSVDTLACTVEMLDPTREFDVAVIDEIQMISDEQRGWAFTQALLGVNAREIYVCGEEAAVNLIKKIAGQSGDRVEVIKYERLSPLVVSKKSLDASLTKLQTGDCVVAFSRKRIFQTKLLIEMKTGKKCAVVYGNLPMENRSLQAKAFNERQEGVDIMVASDAIGMGLNL